MRSDLRTLSVMQVGASTETELKEKKLRVEDALNATKAAVEEGIVIGGGCTLLRLAGDIESIKGEACSSIALGYRLCDMCDSSKLFAYMPFNSNVANCNKDGWRHLFCFNLFCIYIYSIALHQTCGNLIHIARLVIVVAASLSASSCM
jgi:hypothetical protein